MTPAQFLNSAAYRQSPTVVQEICRYALAMLDATPEECAELLNMTREKLQAVKYE